MPSTYDIRLIQAGMKIELIKYENPVIMRDKCEKNNRFVRQRSEKRKESASDAAKIKNRETVLYRARNEVRRIINANVGRYRNEKSEVYKPVFLTLTFADNIQDITAANKELRKFMKRLGNHIAKDQAYVQYVAVPEFQRRGAVHYHLVIFNLPYIKAKTLEEIWSNGFIKVISIDQIDNIGAYISKYMTKASDNDDRLLGQKCYFRSRNLFEPIETRVLSSTPAGQQLLQEIEAMGLRKTYSSSQLSEHYGIIEYTQYQLDAAEQKEVIQND